MITRCPPPPPLYTEDKEAWERYHKEMEEFKHMEGSENTSGHNFILGFFCGIILYHFLK